MCMDCDRNGVSRGMGRGAPVRPCPDCALSGKRGRMLVYESGAPPALLGEARRARLARRASKLRANTPAKTQPRQARSKSAQEH